MLFIIMIWTGSDAGISGGLWVTYIAFVIATLITLVFAAFGVNRKSMIGIGIFAVVMLIAYLIADGSTRPEWNITESTSKLIGAGIGMAVVGVVAAIGTILYGEVTRMLK
ncbi:MAG: hypothetical protein IPM12_02950 [Flavobacteriales bacterium]|nr:hypothetical protein [Flavobacteriales bacterium]